MFSENNNSKAECARIFWCLCEEIQGKESKEPVEVEQDERKENL